MKTHTKATLLLQPDSSPSICLPFPPTQGSIHFLIPFVVLVRFFQYLMRAISTPSSNSRTIDPQHSLQMPSHPMALIAVDRQFRFDCNMQQHTRPCAMPGALEHQNALERHTAVTVLRLSPHAARILRVIKWCTCTTAQMLTFDR